MAFFKSLLSLASECLIQERRSATERLRRLAARHSTSTATSSSSQPPLPPQQQQQQQRSPVKARPKFLRAVYTVGLMCKYFSLEDLANAAYALINDPSSTGQHSSVDLSVLTQQVSQ